MTYAPMDRSSAAPSAGLRPIFAWVSRATRTMSPEKLARWPGRIRMLDSRRVDVPVSHEEVRLEREPITGANRDAAHSCGDITDEEHEVTLRAERPVVSTEAEPVERVRLGKETVTGTETVSGEVRKEQVELDDATGTARDR